MLQVGTFQAIIVTKPRETYRKTRNFRRIFDEETVKQFIEFNLIVKKKEFVQNLNQLI